MRLDDLLKLRLRSETAISSPVLALLLAACGGGGGGGGSSTTPRTSTPTPPADPTRAFNGRVYDGPISGAQVYIDVNENGRHDTGEPSLGRTDGEGRYRGTAPREHADKPILAVLDGATDTDNPNTQLSGIWRAPAGSTVISPLTELLVVDASLLALVNLPDGIDADDIPTYDPFADGRITATERAVIRASEAVAEVLLANGQGNLRTRLRDADEAPTNMVLSRTSFTIDEGTTTAQRLATITFTDDALGTNAARIPASTLFQIRNGNELWLRAGVALDYETPAERTHTITLTATTNSALTRTFTLSVDDVDETRLPEPEPQIPTQSARIYEDYPLNKPVHTFTGDGSFAFTAGYEDNALFQITTDGRLLWLALPDYEAPTDGDRDNIYKVEVTRTASDNTVTKTRLDITVQNIALEEDPADALGTGNDFFTFTPNDIPDAEEPRAFIRHIIHGTAYVMPLTGPLVLTWSLDVAASARLTTQDDIDTARTLLQTAFAEFEAAANIKFIEVGTQGEIPVAFQTRAEASEDDFVGEAFLPAAVGGIRFFSDTLADVQYATIVHEIGHAIGLAHPFDVRNGWPGDNDLYRHDQTTIMSYWSGWDTEGLQENDKEALRWLYGAPDTNWQSPERFFTDTSHQARNPRPNPQLDGVFARTTVAENTSTTTAAYSDDVVPSGQDFDGNTFSLPAGLWDNNLFTIDTNSGQLFFKQSPDFENPHDVHGGAKYGSNNFYEVEYIRNVNLRDIGGGLEPVHVYLIIEVTDVQEAAFVTEIV